MVTGEFYARVTTGSITPAPAAVKPPWDKRPACRWLRSSSYNFPDQRDVVIKSLYKNFTARGARDGPVGGSEKWTHRTDVFTGPKYLPRKVCWKCLLIGKF